MKKKKITQVFERAKQKSIFYKTMKIQALKRLLIKSYHLKLFNN